MSKSAPDQLIHRLSMAVANQIAAGEVVERPAAALKEMMENAVDAGAHEIQVILKDAGRTLIQVIDDGKGMSEADAKLAFERHTTSKIQDINDLQKIQTFGFRGEALASIAAVSQVELRTRRAQDDLGTRLELHAGEIRNQEHVQSAQGSSVAVKNLFYNVPARRRFLKSDAAEFRHLHLEFQKVALCRPEISFSLWHNDEQIYQLSQAGPQHRIAQLFGKRLEKGLVPLDTSTDAVKITGYVGSPEMARKQAGEQFFFVNGRYFRSPYMQKAVISAYAQLIPENTYPAFFVFMDVNLDKVDVNIHPTKSEVKFEEDQVIWQILNASVREALGRFALVPSIDFDMAGAVEIPALSMDKPEIKTPGITINPNYDPFEQVSVHRMPPSASLPKANPWAGIAEAHTGFEEETPLYSQVLPTQDCSAAVLFLKGKYILSPAQDGLWVIDAQRAHYRVLYERYIKQDAREHGKHSISLIFPLSWEVDAVEKMSLQKHSQDFESLGFHYLIQEDKVSLKAIPGDWNLSGAEEEFRAMLHRISEGDTRESDRRIYWAKTLAQSTVRMKSAHWNESEIRTLVSQLMHCDSPDVCPEGKVCFWKLTYNELEKRFNV